jgi:hypothetical protein
MEGLVTEGVVGFVNNYKINGLQLVYFKIEQAFQETILRTRARNVAQRT